MSYKTIVKNATKYFLAVLITMYLWKFAGNLMSAKNDIANIAGFVIYFAMLIGWLLMLKQDITILINKLNK